MRPRCRHRGNPLQGRPPLSERPSLAKLAKQGTDFRTPRVLLAGTGCAASHGLPARLLRGCRLCHRGMPRLTGQIECVRRLAGPGRSTGRVTAGTLRTRAGCRPLPGRDRGNGRAGRIANAQSSPLSGSVNPIRATPPRGSTPSSPRGEGPRGSRTAHDHALELYGRVGPNARGATPDPGDLRSQFRTTWHG